MNAQLGGNEGKVKVLGPQPGTLLPKGGSQRLHPESNELATDGQGGQQASRARRDGSKADFPELCWEGKEAAGADWEKRMNQSREVSSQQARTGLRLWENHQSFPLQELDESRAVGRIRPLVGEQDWLLQCL